MTAYKLFRIKNGKLYPLFINRKKETVMNEWMQAECHETKGFAVRKGWHCCLKPHAPHLKMVLKNGEQRVWVKCEIEDYEYYDRPESQGGTWVLAQRLKVVSIIQNEEVRYNGSISSKTIDYNP